MEPQKNTDMTKKPDQTEMVAKGPKTVRLVVLRPFMVPGTDAKEKRMTTIGEIITVTQAIAKDLTKPMKGAYAFAGERHNADNDIKHHDLRRARLATAQDLQPSKPLDTLED